jgi:uncharacterized protein (TIGR02996 family)
MSEREGFYAAIRANPDDDTARLVFADWLEESGEPRWAAFIRSHVANPDERKASSLPTPLAATIFADGCWSNLPANQITLSAGSRRPWNAPRCSGFGGATPCSPASRHSAG